jgi:hypothetical protein
MKTRLLASSLPVLLALSAVAQTNWALATPPPYRMEPIAFDSARGRTVTFGATYASEGGIPMAVTWEWDGAAWSMRVPLRSPPARSDHSLSYDPDRRRTVLFGGSDGTTDLADTWEWDGNEWQQAAPPSSPPARRLHAMAWDPVNRRTLLFGGVAGGGFLPRVDFADTWSWDGSNWIAATPAVSPPVLQGHSMATDPSRRRIVLTGGSTVSVGNINT